jgi:hypothetical protein
MTKTGSACRNAQNTLLARAVVAFPDHRMPPAIAAHLQDCGLCRRYAEGLRLAPTLFASTSLYGAGLKHRSLAAVARAADSGDWQLGLLLAPAGAVSVLVSFLLQMYFVNLTLSKVFDSALLIWTVSFVAVSTIVVVAGGLCLTLLWRCRMQGHRLQEVSHD